MDALTDQQAAFATAYVSTGGNGSAAAREAGYSAESARQAAYRLVRLPHVQAAIVDQQRRQLNELSSLAVVRLREILSIPVIEEIDGRKVLSPIKPSTYVDAAKMVFDRSGLGPKSDGEGKPDSKPLSEMTLAELEGLRDRVIAGLPLVGSSVSDTSIDGKALENGGK